MELLERSQMVTIGVQVSNAKRSVWDNDCLVHQELCFHANIMVFKYSRVTRSLRASKLNFLAQPAWPQRFFFGRSMIFTAEAPLVGPGILQ